MPCVNEFDTDFRRIGKNGQKRQGRHGQLRKRILFTSSKKRLDGRVRGPPCIHLRDKVVPVV